MDDPFFAGCSRIGEEVLPPLGKFRFCLFPFGYVKGGHCRVRGRMQHDNFLRGLRVPCSQPIAVPPGITKQGRRPAQALPEASSIKWQQMTPALFGVSPFGHPKALGQLRSGSYSAGGHHQIGIVFFCQSRKLDVVPKPPTQIARHNAQWDDVCPWHFGKRAGLSGYQQPPDPGVCRQGRDNGQNKKAFFTVQPSGLQGPAVQQDEHGAKVGQYARILCTRRRISTI